MSAADALAFVNDHHRAILVTRRRDGRLQTSPIVCATDDDGHVVVSVTVDRAKAKNVRRDPRVTLCAFTDDFFGPWVQIDGQATIVDLPEAMPGLKELYRRVSGEHPNWADYEAAMERDGRCLIVITPDS